jgi:transposase
MVVVVGVDVHKRTHTLVAVDQRGRKLGQKTIETTSRAHSAGIRWARAKFGDDTVWGVEDCRGLTARLERDLLYEGLQVVRVPPHLMSRTRSSSREGGKSDPIDALAVARTVLREPNLPIATHNPASMELQLLVRRRNDVVSARTAVINRLVGRVHQLDPRHPIPNWSCTGRRAELHDWLAARNGDLIAELAIDELADIDRLSESMDALERRIGNRVRAIAPTLLALQGCGELTAATIVAEVADIARFRSEAAFARYAGVAPEPRWSGNANTRMRSSRRGNRQLNKAMHQISVTQTRWGGPGKEFLERRLTAGDSRPRAMQALKRRITRVVYNRLKANQPTTDGPCLAGPKLPQVFMLPLADLQAGRERRIAETSPLT